MEKLEKIDSIFLKDKDGKISTTAIPIKVNYSNVEVNIGSKETTLKEFLTWEVLQSN